MVKLPPIPPTDTHCFDEDTGEDCFSHSPAQMQSYGQACRAAALEEAAGVIEADIYPAPLTAYQKQYNAGIALRVLKIRRMK